MNELVQNVLELAKIDMGMELKQEILDMNGFVSNLLDEFQSQAEAKKQKLLLEKAAGQPTVRGDALQLKQAMRNLVGNAIKYTPASGSITISLEANEEMVIISVKDNGYGIPAGICRLSLIVFIAPMTKGLKIVEGNGLGLAITKSITERHNGRVNVKSEPGKGSCFTIMLPIAEQETGNL